MTMFLALWGIMSWMSLLYHDRISMDGGERLEARLLGRDNVVLDV